MASKEVFSIIAWNINWDPSTAPDDCGEFSSYDAAFKKAQKLEEKYDRVRILLKRIGPAYPADDRTEVYSAHRKRAAGLSPGWVRRSR